MGKDKGIRFGVRSGDRRAATWVVVPKPAKTGKNDVYVACRELGAAIHISLHDSGRWHIAYDRARATSGELFDEPIESKDCYVHTWDRPRGVDFAIGCRIVVPHGASTVVDQHPDGNVSWFNDAHEGNAFVFLVGLTEQEPTADGWWPGKDVGTHLVGALPLGGGDGHVCVIGIEATFSIAAVQPRQPHVRFFKDKGPDDYKVPGLRALAIQTEAIETYGLTLLDAPAERVASQPQAA